LTGPRLRAEGVESIADFTQHAAMLAGVLGNIGRGWRTVRLVEREWRANRPDLVVLMDSGTLHLPMARRAKKLGIPVLYYIAPQTWASRAYRNRTLARCVDHVACILPFEQEYFRGAGVNATFVGHPLFESLARERTDDAALAHLRKGDAPLIAVLPGSRRHVIETMLPLQLRVLEALKRDGVPFRAAVSASAEDRVEMIQDALNRSTINADIVTGNTMWLSAADLVLVASGTATLHVAHYRKPMVVMYHAGALMRRLNPLLRRLVKTPHLCLVNILARRRIVPEFMPFVPDVAPVARVARDLLDDQAWRDLMMRQLDEIVGPLEQSDASSGVCNLIEHIWRSGSPVP
jgi:lipid-A-disaccharide synthase